MDPNITVSIVAIVVLLVISAGLSGSETALTAASRARIHHLARGGNRRARIVTWLLDRREELISTVLLGNNVVNILASSLATSVLIHLFGQAGVAYATAIMTVLIVAFGEVLPKTYAIRSADRVALAVAPSLRVVYWVLAPLTALVLTPVRLTLRLLTRRAVTLVSPVDEIRGAVYLHAATGAIYKHDRNMIESILELSEVEVGDVMVHRTNMVTIDIDEPSDKIIAELLACPFSRVPMWKDNPDNVVGVLHVKDVLRAIQAASGDATKVNVRDLIVAPWFVPETTTLREQMNAFRRRHQYLAIVVDEYGSLQGLVSLADILEEIVGDLAAEPERRAEPSVRRLPDGRYIVSGTAAVRDLNRDLEWNLPDEDAATVAGLVINAAEELPEVGQSYKIGGFGFEVLRRSQSQIISLRVTPPAAGDQAPPP
jgi:Mg2+/Co2+ transporter CorB